MIVLWILLGLLFIVFALLLIPASITVSFDGDVHAVARYLFLKFNLTETEEKEEASEDKKNSDKKDEDKPQKDSSLTMFKQFFKREGISGLLNLISEASKIIANATKGIVKHLKFKRFKLNLCIATGDASDTAMLYGKICPVISGAYYTLFSLKKCRKKTTTVTCDFEKDQTTAEFLCKLSIRPIFLLSIGLKMIIKIIPLYRRLKPAKPKDKTAVKVKQ